MLAGEPFLAHPTFETVGVIIVVRAGMEVTIVPPTEGAHTVGTGVRLLSSNLIVGLEVGLPIVLSGECSWAPGASVWPISRVSPCVGYWREGSFFLLGIGNVSGPFFNKGISWPNAWGLWVIVR
jgi:hypothetical protein